MPSVNFAQTIDLARPKYDDKLDEDDYVRLSEHAAAEIRRYVGNMSLWNPHSSSKEGIEVFERKSDLPGAKESMLLVITDLPCTLDKAEKLILPMHGYRLKWDDMMDSAKMIQSWPEKDIYVTQNLIKKQMIMSPRESIDVMKAVRREEERLFGWTGASHPSCPPMKGYVRTHQCLGGYVLRVSDSNPAQTKFYMLFQADLNLPVPRLLGNMLAKFKPDLLVKSAENLKVAARKIEVS